MGAIVSFYFGARHQTKTQEFQKGLSATLARTSQVAKNISALDALDDGYAPNSDPEQLSDAEAEDVTENAALDDWRGRA